MPIKKWTYETCKQIASEFTTLKDFRCKYPSAYSVAKKNGWTNDYEWLRVSKNHGYWTYEKCYEEAKKYETRKQFQVGSGSAYDKALKEKWLDDYTWFKPSATAIKWDYENCFNEAQKYKTLAAFIKKCGRAYNVARKNGWLKEYKWLIIKDISKKKVLQYSLDGRFVARYNGVREASRVNGFSNACISACCNGQLNSHKGFIWKFEE